VLLRAYRHLSRAEDLEDCYSQATVELLAHVRRGGKFAGTRHVSNTLELRFVSRIRDVRRALGGRSPIQAALVKAVSLDAAEQAEAAIVDRRADVEQLVLMRSELREVRRSAGKLSADQRLVLASQLLDTPCAAFCSEFGWSAEKYRKVAQRGRARLKQLVSGEEARVPFQQPGRNRQAGTVPMTADHTPIGTSPTGKPSVGSGDDRPALPTSAQAAGSCRLPVSASGRPRARPARRASLP
jgi:DNA-directed RNA polymerase specialized sigma24 family protein